MGRVGRLVSVVFGEKWSAMVASLQILSIAGSLLALLYLIGAVLGGVGRPEVAARDPMSADRDGPAGLSATRAWGIAGAATSVTFGAFVGLGYMLIVGSGRCSARRGRA